MIPVAGPSWNFLGEFRSVRTFHKFQFQSTQTINKLYSHSNEDIIQLLRRFDACATGSVNERAKEQCWSNKAQALSEVSNTQS